jgi:hypothetical protein
LVKATSSGIAKLELPSRCDEQITSRGVEQRASVATTAGLVLPFSFSISWRYQQDKPDSATRRDIENLPAATNTPASAPKIPPISAPVLLPDELEAAGGTALLGTDDPGVDAAKAR